MNRNQKTAGLTLIDLLVIIAVFAAMAGIMFPGGCGGLEKAKAKAKRISCMNNLKSVGVAFCVWAGDNNEKYPMELSITNGGAMEAIASGDLVTVFEVMSNELNSPKLLFCPSEWLTPNSTRQQASAFGRTSRLVNSYTSAPFSGNSNVTYFVGLDASTNLHSAFLSGDDNILVGTNAAKSGILSLTKNSPVAWSGTRHAKMGNVGLVDGSVQGFSTFSFRAALETTRIETNRLALP